MLTASLQAQEFKKFKVGLGLGYALPTDGSGGVLLYLEPMYRVADNIGIGLRIESAALLASPVNGISVSASAVSSYTLNGQYYFSNNKFRPFVGAGFGMFSLAAASVDVLGGGSVALGAATTKFGFYPRVGFDLGHFNLSIDYNIIPATSSSVAIPPFGTITTSQNSSYIGVRIGASIGGGQK